MHKLCLLGGLSLHHASSDASVDKVIAQSKTVATLAYLALAPAGRFQRRDRIAALLWPELDQEHARAALRKCLHVIRGSLGDAIVIAHGDEQLALSREELWCDAVAFHEACEEGALAHALELYEGELMPGFHLPECGDFDLWLEIERRQLAERAAAAAWALAERLERDKKMTLAGQWARRAVHYAGTDERVLRRTMVMLDRLGDRAGALRLFSDFKKRLKKELEAEPSAETVQLAHAMREPRA
jgi:DNA-binding SARP family transcriptional activator